ncbi:MAG: DNA internalization-related competence protein ComEC/Rec2 [Snodgrassella sp.]|nr:DNA internalization-related competence protein ComEC/Rec2 [Snodgrassella sp.]
MSSQLKENLAYAWLPWWVMGVCCSFLLPLSSYQYWVMATVLLGLMAIKPGWRWCRNGCLLCIGVMFAIWRTEAALTHQWPLSDKSDTQQVTLIVTDIAQTDQFRTRFFAKVRLNDGRTQNWLVNDYGKQRWPAGSQWRVKAKVRAVISETNIIGFNKEAWALANHIGAEATLKGKRELITTKLNWTGSLSHWRAKLSERWQKQQAVYPQGVALLKALAVGEQSALPAQAWQIFRPLGLNHLVSISGLHVGMLAMLAAWLCGKLLHLLPVRIEQPWIYKRSVAVITAVIYSALAGFAVPTQRSMLMIMILAMTWRRGHLRSMQIWWLTIAIVLLYDPLAVLSVGFWLSFLLVAALMWAGEGTGQLSKLRQLLQSQWAAGMASLVLVAYIFGSVPLMSAPVNALAIPWFTLVLVPVALISLILPIPFLADMAAWISEKSMQALYATANYAPEYYPAHAPLGLWLLATIGTAILLLPRGFFLRPLCLLVLLMLLLYKPSRPLMNEARVTIWDIGQGLAVSISTARHDLLFDTGTDYAAKSILLPNLQAIGIKRLDTLVLSHNDADHDGGAELVKAKLRPQQILAGQAGAYPFAVKHCQAGINWQWDGVWFEFLNQPVNAQAKKNDQSCVLRVVSAGKSVLITGDLAKRGERKLVAAYGDKLYSQILLLGHHGSRTSSDAEFIRVVRPDYAIASTGFANRYNHPHLQVQELIKKENISFLRTDRMGGIETTLSIRSLQWQPLSQIKPYWQRKPMDKP